VTPERFRTIEALYHDALTLQRHEREDFLARACAGDVLLRDEVASLLTANDDASQLLERVARSAVAPGSDEVRPLIPVGTKIGPYEVTSLLGRGGMGDVYRAHDPRLGRDVALKVLSPYLLLDPDRGARLRQEARVLAQLNHPNIAMLYGVEESEGQYMLVLELVEGFTLVEQLASGPMALPEVMRVATQIVDALDAAHRRGIVHRDLKPANIAIRNDGVVKVLDFGLALGGAVDRPLTPEAGILDGSSGPTLIGTLPYMSPEQLRGAHVNHRVDIWAFGCVLYEMLAGRRVFNEATEADLVAAIVHRAPDRTPLAASTPMPIRSLVERCLAKDPDARPGAMAEVRAALRECETAVRVTPRGRRYGARSAVAALLSVAAVAATTAWLLRPGPPRPAPQVTRFAIPAATGRSFGGRSFAISPDGSRVAHASSRGLIVRSRERMDGEELLIPAPLVRAPFFSPDSQFIGFADGQALYKVAASGGEPVRIADADAAALASWSSSGILFADVRGLFRVSPDGGRPELLAMREPLENNEQAAYPELLPGGHAVLFTVLPIRTISVGWEGNLAGSRLEVLDLRTGVRRTVAQGASRGRYLSSGHVVYAGASSLRVVPFSLSRLEAVGPPATVISDISYGEFAISDDGTLVYVTGGGQDLSTLVWVDRQGREEPIGAPAAPYLYPRLSPDETRIALDVGGPPDRNVYIWDSQRKALALFTQDRAGNPLVAWSPDGSRLSFGSDRFGATQVFVQAVDGRSEPERLLRSDRLQMPLAFTPDGRLLFSEEVPKRGRDIKLLWLDGSGRIEPLVQGVRHDANAEVSPDGRWLAYDSEESGRFEVYVRPYPDVDRASWQVSVSGGRQPLWSKDGHELFYRDFSGALLAVPIVAAPSFSAGPPTTIVERGYIGAGAALSGRTYDVSRDRRFLMLKPLPSTPTSLVMVVNWVEAMARQLTGN
jgi:serine/threonine-protein kinase